MLRKNEEGYEGTESEEEEESEEKAERDLRETTRKLRDAAIMAMDDQRIRGKYGNIGELMEAAKRKGG